MKPMQRDTSEKSRKDLFKRHMTAGSTSLKSRQPWTQEEDERLLSGVEKYGLGKWAKIRDAYFPEGNRTSVQIKDRMRNIQNQEEKSQT